METKVAAPYAPGTLIQEELEARGWTQQRLADAMGKSHALVSEIVNAKRSITQDTALALAEVFGTSAEVWLNLDARYQLDLRRAQEDAPTGQALRAALNAKVPLRAMVRRGWIPDQVDLTELKRHVLAFTEQESLAADWQFSHAARKSSAYGISTPEQFVWLCRARQLAHMTTVRGRWSRSRTGELVGELRRLILSPPAIQDAPRVLSDFGIRLVIVERLRGMKMDGAMFWLEKAQPVIALAFRYDRIDNAWHTIMHEIGHIANDDGLAVDEEIMKRGDQPESERKADEFAIESLVPQDKLADFCSRVAPLYSELRITGFANLHRVHPGIVVGQLHRRGRDNRGLDYTHFRRFLVPVRHFVTENATTDGWGNTFSVDE